MSSGIWELCIRLIFPGIWLESLPHFQVQDMPMQTKSWVSELLFDCIYSRCLLALVLAGLLEVQCNVRCAECCKKTPTHQFWWIFCLAVIGQAGDTALLWMCCVLLNSHKDIEAWGLHLLCAAPCLKTNQLYKTHSRAVFSCSPWWSDSHNLLVTTSPVLQIPGAGGWQGEQPRAVEGQPISCWALPWQLHHLDPILSLLSVCFCHSSPSLYRSHRHRQTFQASCATVPA